MCMNLHHNMDLCAQVCVHAGVCAGVLYVCGLYENIEVVIV